MLAHHYFTTPKAEDLQFDHRVSNKVYIGYIKTVYLLELGQPLIRVKDEMLLNLCRRYRKAGISTVVQYQKISVNKVLENLICFINTIIYSCLFANILHNRCYEIFCVYKNAYNHFFAQIGLYEEAFCCLHFSDKFQIIKPCLNVEFPYTMNIQLADGQKNTVGMLS